LAPVHTILPDAKMSAVVLGSRMRMMTAAKRCAAHRAVAAHRQCVGPHAYAQELAVTAAAQIQVAVPIPAS
jgi:hypothetical protein